MKRCLLLSIVWIISPIEIGSQIQEFLLLVWPQDKIDEKIEKFNLDVSLKSVRIDFILF